MKRPTSNSVTLALGVNIVHPDRDDLIQILVYKLMSHPKTYPNKVTHFILNEIKCVLRWPRLETGDFVTEGYKFSHMYIVLYYSNIVGNGILLPSATR